MAYLKHLYHTFEKLLTLISTVSVHRVCIRQSSLLVLRVGESFVNEAGAGTTWLVCIFKENTPCRADMGGGVAIHGQMAPSLTVALKVPASFRRCHKHCKKLSQCTISGEKG